MWLLEVQPSILISPSTLSQSSHIIYTHTDSREVGGNIGGSLFAHFYGNHHMYKPEQRASRLLAGMMDPHFLFNPCVFMCSWVRELYKTFIQGANLNSYELWLTHKALTLAFKTLYKLGLNITAQLTSGSLKWDEKILTSHVIISVGGLQC